MSHDKQEDVSFHRQIYLDHRGRLLAARQSSFEQFDKAILTLSSGALALSLGFVQTVTASRDLKHLCLIIFSWVLFLIAIVATVLSFGLAPKALDAELDSCDRYFFEGDAAARDTNSFLTKAVGVLNLTAGIAFVIAILLSIIFVIINL